MRLPITFLVVFLMISSGILNAQSTSGTSATDANIETINDERFQISYPATWKADRTGTQNTVVILYLPSKAGAPKFSDNINLMIQDLSGYNMNLESFTDLSVGQLKEMMPEIKIISNNRKKMGGFNMQRLTFKAVQAGFNLRFEQRYYVINDTAFVLTATYLEENAALQAPKIQMTLNTFKPIVGK